MFFVLYNMFCFFLRRNICTIKLTFLICKKISAAFGKEVKMDGLLCIRHISDWITITAL